MRSNSDSVTSNNPVNTTKSTVMSLISSTIEKITEGGSRLFGSGTDFNNNLHLNRIKSENTIENTNKHHGTHSNHSLHSQKEHEHSTPKIKFNGMTKISQTPYAVEIKNSPIKPIINQVNVFNVEKIKNDTVKENSLRLHNQSMNSSIKLNQDRKQQLTTKILEKLNKCKTIE